MVQSGWCGPSGQLSPGAAVARIVLVDHGDAAGCGHDDSRVARGRPQGFASRRREGLRAVRDGGGAPARAFGGGRVGSAPGVDAAAAGVDQVLALRAWTRSGGAGRCATRRRLDAPGAHADRPARPAACGGPGQASGGGIGPREAARRKRWRLPDCDRGTGPAHRTRASRAGLPRRPVARPPGRTPGRRPVCACRARHPPRPARRGAPGTGGPGAAC